MAVQCFFWEQCKFSSCTSIQIWIKKRLLQKPIFRVKNKAHWCPNRLSKIYSFTSVSVFFFKKFPRKIGFDYNRIHTNYIMQIVSIIYFKSINNIRRWRIIDVRSELWISSFIVIKAKINIDILKTVLYELANTTIITGKTTFC